MDIVSNLRQSSDIFHLNDDNPVVVQAAQAADEIERLRSALERLINCPAIGDGDLGSDAWGCPESAAAEAEARELLSKKQALRE